MNKSKKIAIVLFNLGGPDKLESVKDFLFNLFYDKAIINLSNPFRYIVAKLISIFRNKKSQGLYSLIGNKSPILQETITQKNLLEKKLEDFLDEKYQLFIAMRYFQPMAKETIESLIEYKPTEIILFPLYPQFSTVTTESSIKSFMDCLHRSTIKHTPIKAICCYPNNDDFINAHVELIKKSIVSLKNNNFRILFSAHSLPERIINKGDPYKWQIEESVKNIIKILNIQDLDYIITYQSKVGLTKWLQPDTKDEIEQAGKENKSLIVVPISFTSEHVETLVELDIEYAKVAYDYGIEYIRTPALSFNELFIKGMAEIISNLVKNDVKQMQNTVKKRTQNKNMIIINSQNERICPKNFNRCIMGASKC